MTIDNTGHPQGGGIAGNPQGAPYQPQTQQPQQQVQMPYPHMPQPHQPQQQQPTYQPPLQQQQPQQPQYAPGTVITYDANGQPVVTAPTATPTATPTEPSVPSYAEAEQQVTAFLKSAGVSADQVKQEMVAFGQLTEGTKKALVDKHGAATANLIMGNINQIAQGMQAQAAALETMQHNMVGEAFKGVTQQTPAESWNELLTWCRTNIDVSTRTQLNAMMQAGGFQAEQAIKYMIDTLKAKTGVEQHGAPVQADGSRGASAGVGDLDASTYAREHAAAVQKFGLNSPEVAALDQRRMATRARTGY